MELPHRLTHGCNSFVLIDAATDRYLFAPESHIASDEAEALAGEIERRWNAHEEMVAALRHVGEMLREERKNLPPDACLLDAYLNRINYALARAAGDAT